MKKVLVIHNKYRNIGGEDIAVNNEIKLLKKHYIVEDIIYSNNSIFSLSSLASFITSSNFRSTRLLKNKLLQFKPDIVYVHNTWFQASLGLFRVLKKSNIKTVVKLHNFRYRCTNTFFSSRHFDNQELCFSCGLNKKDVGVFNKYFTNSYIKSLLICIYGKRYFKILGDSYFNILVLTNFHMKYFKNIHPHSNVATFPNYINLDDQDVRKDIEKYFIYAGRISKEKGVEHLIDSFIDAGLEGFKLKIVGYGPEYAKLVNNKYQNVEFLGEISNEETLNLIRKSYCAVTATRLWEGQPTLLCEASSLGTPSIYPNFGGMSEFFRDSYSLSFKQFDYKDLTKKLVQASDNEFNIKVGNQNKKFLKNFLHQEKLIDIFESIISE